MYQVQSLNLGTTTLALQLAPWFADNAFPLMPHAGDVNENHHENCHHFEGRNRMIWISVFSFVLKMICSDLIPWDEHHHFGAGNIYSDTHHKKNPGTLEIYTINTHVYMGLIFKGKPHPKAPFSTIFPVPNRRGEHFVGGAQPRQERRAFLSG